MHALSTCWSGRKQPDAPRGAKAFARTYHQAHVRPDLNIGDQKSLFDVKTLHGSTAAYTKEHTAGITAVESRAAKVPDEYLQKIRARDAITHPSAHRTPHNNDIGPLETKFNLEQMSVTGLAFGMYGETSRSVLDLVAVLASAGAPIHLKTARTSHLHVAEAQLRAVMVRRLGVAVVRSRACATASILNRYPETEGRYAWHTKLAQGRAARALRHDPDQMSTHALDSLQAVPRGLFHGVSASQDRHALT